MKLFATIIALAGVFAASAQAHQETNISKWQFSQTGAEWKAVTVPHDWAISGPFDKKWDLQVVAIKENGEDKPPSTLAAPDRSHGLEKDSTKPPST